MVKCLKRHILILGFTIFPGVDRVMIADNYVGQIHSHEDGLYCDDLRIDWRADCIAELKHPGLSSVE